jgi:uncharacterized protein (TIGR02996 family)
MTHDDAFLQAILDAPDDDTPRLVYADWLEEHAEPERAEFIRVQCRLARTPEGDPRRQVLEARERELLDRQDEWLGRLRSPLLHWKFRRGLVDGFAHAGIFKSTGSVGEDEDDLENPIFWGYLRLYADGRVLFAVSDETPAEVARWFRRGPRPEGERDELSTGRYTLRPAPRAVELSFGLWAFYETGMGQLDFRGTIEVEQDLFATGCLVQLLLEVHNRDEGWSGRQVYQLVEVPGYDSASDP